MRNPTPWRKRLKALDLGRLAYPACYALLGVMYLSGYHGEASVGLIYLAMAALVARAHRAPT